MKSEKLDGNAILYPGDCLEVLDTLKENSIDSCVTDPPYHLVSIVKRFGSTTQQPAKAKKGKDSLGGAMKRLSRGFMGQQWDGGDIAFRAETWEKVLRVLKPGGFLLAFCGTRTYHRMVCAIEDAGFEVRDSLLWLYGAGFPKSLNISKAIDKQKGAKRKKVRHLNPRNPKVTGGGRDGVVGATRPWIEEAMKRGYHEKDGDESITKEAKQWDGWGTALKPAMELVVMARKPMTEKNTADNVLKWGVGGINIDACRIGESGGSGLIVEAKDELNEMNFPGWGFRKNVRDKSTRGRFPSNVLLDGSDQVVNMFPVSKSSGRQIVTNKPGSIYGNGKGIPAITGEYGFDDEGSAARFFYSSKADGMERSASGHPTIKPVDLLRYLIRLVTPKGATVLDLFAGTGTTGEAAFFEGMKSILIEREKTYQDDIRKRMRTAIHPYKRKILVREKSAQKHPIPTWLQTKPAKRRERINV